VNGLVPVADGRRKVTLVAPVTNVIASEAKQSLRDRSYVKRLLRFARNDVAFSVKLRRNAATFSWLFSSLRTNKTFASFVCEVEMFGI
jgi:hypothetical protein